MILRHEMIYTKNNTHSTLCHPCSLPSNLFPRIKVQGLCVGDKLKEEFPRIAKASEDFNPFRKLIITISQSSDSAF